MSLRLDRHEPQRLEHWKSHLLLLDDLGLIADRHLVLYGKDTERRERGFGGKGTASRM